ncbi:amidohydrolase [Nitriliruptoraceae bacterium ZYF776]|nr:amidohydrolase [Profundirhabdus halotolerans]
MVWTGTGRPTDAVAVVDGRIVALGSEARERRGTRTEVVPVTGTLLPSFRDGHVHPLDGGAETLACDLVDAADVDEVVARVGSYVAADDGGPDDWVLGYGYPPELLPGGVGEARHLDPVTAGRPTALWSSDHHMVWVNTAALRVAGITAATPEPARGTVVRDADGTPVGTLLEEAERLLEDHLPPRGHDTEEAGLRVGLERLGTAGITWAQDAWTVPDRLGRYLAVAAAGDLTVDLDLAFKAEVDRWREQVGSFADARRDAEVAAGSRLMDGVPGARLTARTVKFFVDGVIEGGTAALLAPYLPLPGAGCGDVHDHGIANWDLGELTAAIGAVDAAGFEVHLHAIGDAAVRTALDAIEEVVTAGTPRDRRPVIAHTHLVDPYDVPRFAQLGVTANFEPLWAQPNAIMRELTEPRLGAERSRWQYAVRSVLTTGANVSFGSDWPVSSHVPLEGLAVATTRRSPEEPDLPPLFPEERLPLDDALAAYTRGTALQAGDDDAGRVEVGAPADLVLVDQDVTAVPLLELGEVSVLGTWRAGTRTHGDA